MIDSVVRYSKIHLTDALSSWRAESVSDRRKPLHIPPDAYAPGSPRRESVALDYRRCRANVQHATWRRFRATAPCRAEASDQEEEQQQRRENGKNQDRDLHPAIRPIALDLTRLAVDHDAIR